MTLKKLADDLNQQSLRSGRKYRDSGRLILTQKMDPRDVITDVEV